MMIPTRSACAEEARQSGSYAGRSKLISVNIGSSLYVKSD
jgi:hypothetical protein